MDSRASVTGVTKNDARWMGIRRIRRDETKMPQRNQDAAEDLRQAMSACGTRPSNAPRLTSPDSSTPISGVNG